MTAIGVDACPAGWVATILENETTSIETYPEFSDLTERYDDAERILVDIPIGLPETERRRCDKAARELLGCRQSSVFFPPCETAAKEVAYQTASEAHQEQIGWALSTGPQYQSENSGSMCCRW